MTERLEFVGELRIDLSHTPRMIWYYGTRQQLIDEGIVADLEKHFPARTACGRFQVRPFDYWLQRKRPPGNCRGAWADADYWMLWVIDDRYTNDDTDEHQKRLAARRSIPVPGLCRARTDAGFQRLLQSCLRPAG